MKAKSVFFCTECGNETGKWFGRCPACGAWNTIVEAPSAPSGNAAAKSAAVKIAGTRRSVPKPVAQLDDEEEIRFSTGMAEMDRVLGGGAVHGSFVLVGGEPGIGKSTLLLQVAGLVAALRDDFVGHEAVRELLCAAPRYGNNDMYADGIGREMERAAQEFSRRYARELGVMMDVRSISVTANVPFGKVLGASANGRRAGMPVSDGTSASQGADLSLIHI